MCDPASGLPLDEGWILHKTQYRYAGEYVGQVAGISLWRTRDSRNLAHIFSCISVSTASKISDVRLENQHGFKHDVSWLSR